jgi:hypothetical protein
MNFFTPKFMKIRCIVPLFEAFDSHFHIEWAIYGLIFIFKYVSIKHLFLALQCLS